MSRSRTLGLSLALLTAVLCAGPSRGAVRTAPARTSTSELVLELRPGHHASEIAASLKSLRWRVLDSTRAPHVTEVLRLGRAASDAAASDRATAELSALASVRAVEPNSRVYRPEQSEIPVFYDDYLLADVQDQAAISSTGLLPPTTPSIYAPVRVAVLDGGFDLSVEALEGRCMQGYDAIDEDLEPEDGGNSVDDDEDGTTDSVVGHGTAVAALIAVAAPECVIMPVRVLDDEGRASAYDLVKGLAASRAAEVGVIHISVGAFASSMILDSALAQTRSLGFLVVASAGNSQYGGVTYPATSQSVVAITGVTSEGLRAPSASIGAAVAAAAPSVDVIAPYPGMTSGYGTWSGTSFAAALFSAAAARVLQNEGGDPLDAAAALLECLAEFPSEAAPDSTYMGDGILDASSLLGD